MSVRCTAKAKGFTLIELLVVIAIIGVLSSVVLASLNSARNRAADARRVSDLRQIQNALELYAQDNNGLYPSSGGSWRSQCNGYGGHSGPNVISGLVPTYLPSMPADPAMNIATCDCSYLYTSNSVDYKLLAHSCSTSNYQSQRSLLDPARDGGSNGAIVEPGFGAWSWAVYTPSAATW